MTTGESLGVVVNAAGVEGIGMRDVVDSGAWYIGIGGGAIGAGVGGPIIADAIGGAVRGALGGAA